MDANIDFLVVYVSAVPCEAICVVLVVVAAVVSLYSKPQKREFDLCRRSFGYCALKSKVNDTRDHPRCPSLPRWRWKSRSGLAAPQLKSEWVSRERAQLARSYPCLNGDAFVLLLVRSAYAPDTLTPKGKPNFSLDLSCFIYFQ